MARRSGTKEMVSLRLDRDVLDFFQGDGPGWQERINAALRKAAGKSSLPIFRNRPLGPASARTRPAAGDRSQRTSRRVTGENHQSGAGRTRHDQPNEADRGRGPRNGERTKGGSRHGERHVPQEQALAALGVKRQHPRHGAADRQADGDREIVQRGSFVGAAN